MLAPIVGLLLLPLLPWAARAQGALCASGPLPENPDNRIELCSPSPDSVQARILTTGVELSWDAPPRATSSYVSPIVVSHWAGLAEGDTIQSLDLTGTYLSFRDRRIVLTVLTIDSLGTALDQGIIGRDRIRIAWTSKYEGSRTRAIAGSLEFFPGYAHEKLRFDVPNRDPLLLPDTTTVAGIRVRVTPGTVVKRSDEVLFDLEDFEGWHVWRWGGDPTSPTFESLGEYSKLVATAVPLSAWIGTTPSSRRLTFLDRNVFDGFIYHYAITTYDQGFRRATSGNDLAIKIESPLDPAHVDAGGNVVLGPAQKRVEYRRRPPAEFHPIAAVPNPFRDDAVDPLHQETQKVSFINVPPRGTLYIYTLAGDLVYKNDHNQPDIGTVDWDTRNQSSHDKVASGVYIYKIVDLVSGEQSYGRLAIIR